jgi:hypothetical protein
MRQMPYESALCRATRLVYTLLLLIVLQPQQSAARKCKQPPRAIGDAASCPPAQQHPQGRHDDPGAAEPGSDRTECQQGERRRDAQRHEAVYMILDECRRK